MKERIWMVVFVLILGTLWTSVLVAVNALTLPTIEKYELEKVRMSVLGAFSIPFDRTTLDKVYEENIEVAQKGDLQFYRNNAGDIAFKIAGNGTQGPISGVVALESDLTTIKGITIVHQEETPGLGDRVFEKETLDRFRGKKIKPGILVVPPGAAKSENEVDGISGATLTCKAFEKILNNQANQYLAAAGK